ncbi:NifB/NifX family molybdenum-iron cluster-binding protein [Candidatus Bipolaricaulota bacterium]|nr:NifB/NifX family molybdenum-iron cluster-binding protein [Candidatus Bipolaricaulota bacterium]
MKEIYVAATALGGLDDQISPVFGRASTFTVVEVEGGKILGASVVENPFHNAPGGAGIRAAQFVAEKRPRAVFAGNFGPNVAEIFAQIGIDMVPVSGRTVRQAVEDYLAGRVTTSPPMDFAPGMGRGFWGANPAFPKAGPQDIAALRERLSRLETELAEVKHKLAELKGGE